jgi:ubiquinone/menaquinone biosynthesis C-methylase UbiE
MEKQEKVWDSLYKKGLKWKKETLKLDKSIQGKVVLELGVGNGKTLRTTLNQNPKHVTALDISKEAINLAKEKIKSDRVTFLKTDFLEFSRKGKFDIIVCYYFLNNFKEKERKEAIGKMKSMLEENGIILFEDFSIGDYRQKGREIEKNTIQKQNGLICHFFTENELEELFNGMNIEVKERGFSPIRTDKTIQRKIISATIRAR